MMPFPVQFYDAAHGNDPVILSDRIIEEILYMGKGKVLVFHCIDRFGKPRLLRDVDVLFHGRDRSCADKISVLAEQGDTDKIVLVGLVKQAEFRIH